LVLSQFFKSKTMLNRLGLLGVICLIHSLTANAQSAFVPLNPALNHLIDRYEIRQGSFAKGFHSSTKPYLRSSVVALADSLDMNTTIRLSDQDEFNLTYLRNDSWEWAKDPKESDSRRPLWNTFFTKQSDFYQYQNKDIDIHINPVLYVGMGKETNGEKSTFINTRGIEVRGRITKKLSFYSFFADNQAVFPSYVRDRIDFWKAVPQEGFYKPFKETGGVDYLSARGYIDFQAVKYINIQFGHDRNFIGNGYRSLILSDNANPYLFLKLTTQIGRFQYQNLFTEINDQQGQTGLLYGQLGPRKFFTFHHLSVNIGKSVNVGVFETEVFGRDKTQGYFDPNYFNPIIFYRAIEQQRNSSDNAMLGLDFKANIARRFQVYGQVMLDEFVLNEIKANKGFWANKIGLQLGGKYINALGIDNLDLQGEINIVRPYTYQHLSSSTNYISYNQSLAHPLGANFNEVIGIARYQPLDRLFLTATLMYAKYGTDATDKDNWGGNPMKDYNTRKQDYGNTVGQGISNRLFLLDLNASYMLKHNLFIDLSLTSRRLDSDNNTLNKNTLNFAAALRWNIGQKQFIF
jgi:hypothetical protein